MSRTETSAGFRPYKVEPIPFMSGATVSVLIADEGYSETHYGTEPLRSDGSTKDPERLLFQTARMPAGFDPGVIPKK